MLYNAIRMVISDSPSSCTVQDSDDVSPMATVADGSSVKSGGSVCVCDICVMCVCVCVCSVWCDIHVD